MHFTYIQGAQNADLQQGDLLKRTPELDAVIAQYHPYYSAKKDYTHFLVLSQSCDLVRRDGNACACPYISLAAVRPLHVAIEREMAPYRQNPLLKRAKAVSNKHRSRMEEFLRKLLNNNDTEYFYLHGEPELALSPSCAFLRLAISIRADEHYANCQRARIVSLSQEFCAKLGWLVGNIFSRVGTQDWDGNLLKAEIKRVLEDNVIWLDEERIKATQLTAEEIEAMSVEAIVERVNSAAVVKRKDQVIAAVLAELSKSNFVRDEDMEPMKKVLAQAPTVASYFKS